MDITTAKNKLNELEEARQALRDRLNRDLQVKEIPAKKRTQVQKDALLSDRDITCVNKGIAAINRRVDILAAFIRLDGVGYVKSLVSGRYGKVTGVVQNSGERPQYWVQWVGYSYPSPVDPDTLKPATETDFFNHSQEWELAA